MSRLSLCILGLSGAALLGACAAPGTSNAPASSLSGSLKSVSSPEGHYALGKYYIGEQRPALALIEFSRAIELDPRHVDARNGRATALAQMGELGEAVAELRRALEIEPRAAHVQNNLGYVQFLRGEFEDAAQSLRRAFALDPKSERVRANWIALAQKLPSGASLTMTAEAQGIDIPLRPQAKAEAPAQAPVATVVAVPAPAVVEHAQTAPAPVQAVDKPSSAVMNVTYGPAPARDAAASASVTIAPATPPAAVEARSEAPAPSAPADPVRTVINIPAPASAPVATAPVPPPVTAAAPVAARDMSAPAPRAPEPQVIPAPAPRTGATETSQVGAVRVHVGIVPAPIETPAAVTPVSAARETPALRKARIEVSNGNGTTGAAAKFGSNLRSNGLQVVRITNATSFANRRSVVYFRDGFVREAVAIAQRLPHRPAVMMGTENNLVQATDIRIVLGRDAPVVVSLMDPPAEAGPVAQADGAMKVASVR